MLFTLLAAIFVLLALVFITAWLLFRKAFCHPRCRDLSDDNTLMQSEFFSYAAVFRPALEWFSAQNWCECTVTADNGTELCGLWLPHKNSRATLLLFHDYCGGPQDMAMLARWGQKKGYSVLAAYERAHGRSGGRYTSLGIKEALDCVAWVKNARELCGKGQQLILCGKGMGATAALLALNKGIEDTVSALICDSPIPDIRELMKRVIRGQLRMQVFPLLQILCLYGKKVWGEHPEEAALGDIAAGKHSIPVFFAAGKKSRLISWGDIQAVANAYTGPKQFFLCDHAGHSAAELADSENYYQALESFLNDNGIF